MRTRLVSCQLQPMLLARISCLDSRDFLDHVCQVKGRHAVIMMHDIQEVAASRSASPSRKRGVVGADDIFWTLRRLVKKMLATKVLRSRETRCTLAHQEVALAIGTAESEKRWGSRLLAIAVSVNSCHSTGWKSASCQGRHGSSLSALRLFLPSTCACTWCMYM